MILPFPPPFSATPIPLASVPVFLNSNSTNFSSLRFAATPVPKSKKTEKMLTFSSYLACGAGAVAFSRLLTAPLDRAKILMQAGGNPASNLVKINIGELVRKEGVASLWRGSTCSLMRNIPTVALRSMMFDRLKVDFSSPPPSEKNAFISGLKAGYVSGVVSAALTYPLDVLRTKVAVQGCQIKLTRTLLNTYKEGALYRGISLVLLETGPFVAVNMATFDLLKTRFPEENKFVLSLFSAGLATTLTHPLDTLRRSYIVHSSSPSLHSFAHQLLKGGGVRRFYAGWGASLLAAAPAIGISQGANDYLKSIWELQGGGATKD